MGHKPQWVTEQQCQVLVSSQCPNSPILEWPWNPKEGGEWWSSNAAFRRSTSQNLPQDDQSCRNKPRPSWGLFPSSWHQIFCFEVSEQHCWSSGICFWLGCFEYGEKFHAPRENGWKNPLERWCKAWRIYAKAAVLWEWGWLPEVVFEFPKMLEGDPWESL